MVWLDPSLHLTPKPTLNDEMMPERGPVHRRAVGEPLVTG